MGTVWLIIPWNQGDFKVILRKKPYSKNKQVMGKHEKEQERRRTCTKDEKKQTSENKFLEIAIWPF